MPREELVEMTLSANIMSRRGLIGGGLAAGLMPYTLQAQAQAPTPIELLVTNSLVAGPLRTTVEQEAGVTITDSPWQSSTDAVSRVAAPGGTSRWDLACSTYDFSKPVIMGAKTGDEKVRPIDLSLVPNLQHVTNESKAGIGERDGKTYMLPLCWGFDTVLYNKTAVPENDPFTQSWAPLFEDKYAGKIGWWDVAHQMLMAAGLYMGHKEPEKMDRAQLDEVAKFLISRKKNVRTMFTTFAQGSALLASGEIVVGYGIVPMRVDLQNRGFPILGAFAKEGVLSLIIALYIPKDAKQHVAAARVINAMLGGKYGGQLTRATGYISASKLAEAGLSPDERKAFGYGIFDGSVKHYLLKFPTNMNMWIETWSRVKSA